MPEKFFIIDGVNPDTEEALKLHRIKIGKDVVFSGSCFFGDAVTVGDSVVFGKGAKIGGHTVIENGARIGESCEIGEGSFIGKGVVIADKVILPRRVFIGQDRGSVDRSEELVAVFSSPSKIEAFFGSDRILMYDPEAGQDYETSISFKEFLAKTKIRQRLRIKQEERRKDFLKNVASVIGILKRIINDKL
jgi:NDP-sugar pyrophosphorylase family protein